MTMTDNPNEWNVTLRARIESLTAQLESTLRDRKLILEERDRTFALMLARAEKAEADNARLRAIGTEMAESIEGNYYLPGVATRWRAALTGKADQAVAGAANDAALYGTGFMLDGEHVPHDDVYAQSEPVAGAALDCVCGMGFGPCKDPGCKAPILAQKGDSHE